MSGSVITPKLIKAIHGRYALPLDGLHGASHWERVRENGLRLLPVTGARRDVVELFSVLHDSCRADEGRDLEHGARAAEFAKTLLGSVFDLDTDGFRLLLEACTGHTHGHTQGDITILTCWDADRLDLGRVGIRPHPSKLCTDAARDPATLAWAYARSVGLP